MESSRDSLARQKMAVENIIIATVACGDRVEEVLALVTSILIFSAGPNNNLTIIIFADDASEGKLKEEVSSVFIKKSLMLHHSKLY